MVQSGLQQGSLKTKCPNSDYIGQSLHEDAHSRYPEALEVVGYLQIAGFLAWDQLSLTPAILGDLLSQLCITSDPRMHSDQDRMTSQN